MMSDSSCRLLDVHVANDIEIDLTSYPDQLRITQLTLGDSGHSDQSSTPTG